MCVVELKLHNEPFSFFFIFEILLAKILTKMKMFLFHLKQNKNTLNLLIKIIYRESTNKFIETKSNRDARRRPIINKYTLFQPTHIISKSL